MTDKNLEEKAKLFLENGLNLPKHILITPDGNRRWAKKNETGYLKGDFVGIKKIIEITEFCLYLGISNITFFASSKKNFGRSAFENLWMKQITKYGLGKFENYLQKKASDLNVTEITKFLEKT